MRTAITTSGLTKRFKNRTAVDSLDLTVQEGELLALLGVNGAGKTTTIKLLTGLLPPTEGRATVLGAELKDIKKVIKQINQSPQETAIAPNLTVAENLVFMARVYGLGAAAKQRSLEMLERFGLTARAKDKAAKLSGGLKRRLSIAMALITTPKLLFLDEPTLGLDVIARRELWETIERLKGSVTVILTTHYLEEAEALADRVAVMAAGKLRAVGTAGELTAMTKTASLEDAFIKLAKETV